MAVREIRCDPLTGEHVILTEARARFLNYHRIPDRRAGADPKDCPFCPDNVDATRPTIQAIEVDGEWVARAFANKAPVVMLEEGLDAFNDGVLWAQGGFGAHEVIVESREHPPLHEQSAERSRTALELAVLRLRDLQNDPRLQTLHWFRNHGPASGGSQRHPHAQILGLPYVPERWQRYAGRSRHHFEQSGRPLLQSMMEDEHRDGRRILATDGPITALCPFASSHPLEVWFVPEAPKARLSDATPEEIEGLARLTRSLVRALERAVGGPVSYNLTTLGAAEAVDSRGVGWHMRLIPRLTRHGGIERGTATFVNGVFPEEAATVLRGFLQEG